MASTTTERSNEENNRRAREANTGLSAYVNEVGGLDEATNIADLFASLFHLCDVHGIDRNEQLRRASRNYRAEVEEHGKADVSALEGMSHGD